MKIWKTIIALASACFAGGFWETTAQETLTIEYTLEGVEGVRHELQVDADEEILEFENIPLTSLTLPEGLTRLRELKVNFFGFSPWGSMTNLTLPEGLKSLEKLELWNCGLTNLTLPKGLVRMRYLVITEARDIPPLTSLKLPEDFGKNATLQIHLFLEHSTERLSVHKNMKEFRLRRYGPNFENFDFPPARELIRNREPDSDGVFRIQSRHSLISGGKIAVGSDGVYRIETRYPSFGGGLWISADTHNNPQSRRHRNWLGGRDTAKIPSHRRPLERRRIWRNRAQALSSSFSSLRIFPSQTRQ